MHDDGDKQSYAQMGIGVVQSDEQTWLNELKNVTLPFDPGLWGAYSGGGVSRVGLIIKRVSPENSFEQYLANHLFGPLKMSSSSINPGGPADRRAQGYSMSSTGSFVKDDSTVNEMMNTVT